MLGVRIKLCNKITWEGRALKVDEKLLTTGQAAKQCSVTPDTILKWIRSGYLPARRTAGGHHRISSRDLQRVVGPIARRESSPASSAPQKPYTYCWEFNGDGNVPAGCKDCAVYRMRAQRCYEVVKLAPEAGHPKIFCDKSCEECDYYRSVHEQAMNVLIVSEDNEMTKRLQQDAAVHGINMEVTDCEYSCSSIVSDFRPDFVIVDCMLGHKLSSDICFHLSQDPRIPFVRIVLAANDGEVPADCDKEVFARIKRPFAVQDILEFIKGAAKKFA
jgi:excisionase family DNA binding protein